PSTMSRTINPGGTPLPDGATVPEGWTMPSRVEEWQRLCLTDHAWCRVFKYVFRLKTGINLDELQDVFFPMGSGDGDGSGKLICYVEVIEVEIVSCIAVRTISTVVTSLI